MSIAQQHQPTAAAAEQAFVMVNAAIQAPGITEPDGFYDPHTQTWIGGRHLGMGTSSSRSNGSRGGYSYQSDD